MAPERTLYSGNRVKGVCGLAKNLGIKLPGRGKELFILSKMFKKLDKL